MVAMGVTSVESIPPALRSSVILDLDPVSSIERPGDIQDVAGPRPLVVV